MKKDGEGEPSFFILRGAIEGDDRSGVPEERGRQSLVPV